MSTKPLPTIVYRDEPDENEGYRFGTALDDLISWALENGYSRSDITDRVADALEEDEDV